MKGALGRLADWLEDRLGYRAILSTLLDEKLPPGTAWAFTLGSVLLFTLAVQFVTGVALGLYYAPTPDHAWDSVRYITNDVRAGGFLRGLHHWGASVIVVAALLHMIRVVVFGSYKKPREANWIVGLILLHVILAFGLTGYLLPWDQRAYWATTVTVSIAQLTPLAGDIVASLMRGGAEIGALTLTRWYAVHVLVLPVLLVSLTIAHLYLMRRHHISGPVTRRTGPEQRFFPHQAARDVTMALIVGTLLAVLAWKGAPALEPPADPASSDYIPRPEWYFLGLFQLLKYFPGRLEVIGALVVPGVVITLLALLPWLDRGPSRRWRDRPVILASFAGGLAALVALTTLGAMDKPDTAAASGQWTLQETAGALMITNDQRCARCHNPTSQIAGPIVAGTIRHPANWIEAHVADPEVIAPGVRRPPQSNEQANRAIMAAIARLRLAPMPHVSDDDAQAIVLVGRECLTCHTIDGAGGKGGPELKNIASKYDLAALEARITDPTQFKADSEMPIFADTLYPEEIAAIAKWVIKR